MTSAKATEFLTRQLSIEKETVTFRWLSRKISVHVNVAKNELASFYASCRATDVPVHATYLLIGDVAPIKAAGSYRDDDEDEMVNDGNKESVATSKIVLVGEDDLETAKAQFTRGPSIHIYSLSPSAIRDAALLAPMADRVRPDDVSKGKAYNQTIGIVVGPGVKIGQTTKAGSSKLAKTKLFTGPSPKLNTAAVAKKVTEQPNSYEKGKAPEESQRDVKQKGTLDWRKAKVKMEKEQENVAVATTTKATKEVARKESKLGLKENGEKIKPEVKKGEDPKVKVKKVSAEANVTTKIAASDKPKRGSKRPPAVMSLSDSEDNNPSPKTKARTSPTPIPSRPASRASGVKVKNGVLLSDNDEERTKEVKPKAGKQRGKGRALVSEVEEEVDPILRAMMDLDDSQVPRHNNRPSVSDYQSDQDIEMLSDDELIPARPKAKRILKKVIPLGKNGLPKRRVIKSSKSKNAKGYTVTADYSSYESVTESEQVQATSDTEEKWKMSRKQSKKDDMVNPGASKAKGNVKSKDKVDDHLAKTGGETGEGKLETKIPGSGSGGGSSTSRPGAKVSHGGRNNLMSYFTKK